MNRIIEQLNEAFGLLGDKFFSWIDKLVLSIPNIVLVILSLIVGVQVIRLILKQIKRITARTIENVSIRNLFISMAKLVLYFLLGILLLGILGLDEPLTAALASAGVAGLAIGLALQDPMMNFFSGIILSTRSTYKVGDFIETNGLVGGVKETTLKATVLRMLTGEEVSIPNKLVLQNPIKNFTTNGNRRVDIDCGISYGEDLRRVKEIAMQSVKEMAITTVDRPVEFIYTSFGDSSIAFKLRFWINSENMWLFLDAKSEAIIRLKEAFDQADINIPFPIRTMDFGIKGGKELHEMLVMDNSKGIDSSSN